ncbi:phage tail tape measure protein [Zobellella sp. An-6]|uniref:phage tail tape measure protein n=1 Tax=Zobellella sp. An-6 TaxID=3400218 RepID=UPI00404326BB
MKHLEQLMLTVGLVDQVTKPIQGINQQLERTGQIGRQSWENIAGGAAGLLASGVALHQALMPAIEMDRVLGEVKSLGVLQEDLDQLNHTATDFAVEFGKSATGFVAAAYDIKSAMGDMSGKELAGITKASGVLAAATKADTATITGYMGTMYGLFKQQAEAMGKDNFAAMVAGQTAQAVEMFKTTGAEMSAAFTSIGANATAAGIDMAEQMAILGTLQATMSGSEAGTKYKAFLNGVASAQDKLNMQFTDANGNMLGMVDILQRLKDQFGDTLTVAESDALKKAFGSDEAVALIKQMLPDIDSLAASIDSVGQQTGMDKATQMAHAMTDQWERLGAVWEALRRGAGQSVLGTINNIVGAIVDQMAVLVEWTQMFPHLTEVVTWAAVGLAGFTALAASWTLIMGIAGSMMAFYKGALLGIVWVLKLLRIGFILNRTAMLAWAAIKMTLVAGTWLLTAAFTALGAVMSFVFSPFFLIAAALVALALGAVWLARNWDGLKATLMDMPWVQAMVEGLRTITAGWMAFWDTFSNLSVLDLLGQGFDWLIEKINLIPGIDIKARSEHTASESINAALAEARQPPALLQAQAAPPILPQMTRAAAQSGGRVSQYGDVYINAGNGMTPEQLAEWEELQHGF